MMHVEYSPSPIKLSTQILAAFVAWVVLVVFALTVAVALAVQIAVTSAARTGRLEEAMGLHIAQCGSSTSSLGVDGRRDGYGDCDGKERKDLHHDVRIVRFDL